jgi:hypothetical protein
MSGRSRRTRKTAVPKASSPPDAIKPALRQTLAELSAKLDVLSMTEDTDLEDQLEKSISEGEAKLRSALAAWAVTRRQSSETERQMRENAAVRGLISAIEHEQKAEEQECWKDHGEMGPLQTALKIFVEACGLSDANTDVEAPPWKPQVYTRLAENGGLFSFKSILANNL